LQVPKYFNWRELVQPKKSHAVYKDIYFYTIEADRDGKKSFLSLLASHGLQHPQPGPGQDKDRGRAGGQIHDPLLSLERLSFLEPEGKVGYRWGRDRAEQEMMDYLEFIARVVSHIPDKGQVTVHYYGLYANAHRGKVRKASLSASVLRMAEEDVRRIPSKGWAEMIREVYEVDPMICPKCGATMKVVAFIIDYPAVDRIIDHLKLRFVAEKPPPSHVFEQVALVAAEERTDYF
jgi:hypothetical protein